LESHASHRSFSKDLANEWRQANEDGQTNEDGQAVGFIHSFAFTPCGIARRSTL
jgi:hypothetical protein